MCLFVYSKIRVHFHSKFESCFLLYQFLGRLWGLRLESETSQESNYESMIDKSVRNTVELQYNSSNVAVLQTFDLLQEGVGMIIINIVVIISVTTIIIISFSTCHRIGWS